MLWASARLIGLAGCREPVQQRRRHISVEMIYELADSAEALAKALRQGSSPSPTLPTVLTWCRSWASVSGRSCGFGSR